MNDIWWYDVISGFDIANFAYIPSRHRRYALCERKNVDIFNNFHLNTFKTMKYRKGQKKALNYY